MSAEQAPKRRSSSPIESSKYAPVQPPEEDRRRWIKSLEQDQAANERAKQEMAAMSRQQGGRPGVQVQLDDVAVQQRKSRYTVGTPILSPAPATELDVSPQPDVAAPIDDQATNNRQPLVSKQLPTQKAPVAPNKPAANTSAPASRTTFEHIEHRPIRSAAVARPLPMASSAAQQRGEYYAPVGAHPPVHDIYQIWEAPRRYPLVVMLLVALVCGPVIWMFLQSPKTFISKYGAPGMSDAVSDFASDSVSKVFGGVNVPAGEHSVVGAPSIDAAAIDTILSKYDSPAAGTGHLWVQFGQEYGIDPAYAVAFFIHESSAGSNPSWAGFKPDGSTTHNVGNIICAGYATCYNRFRDYASWDEGIADWYKLISTEYVGGRGAASVEQIIPIYAPSSDNNDVPGYINVVVSMVEGWRQGVLR